MAKLYFFSGASGSGKTSISKELYRLLGNKIKVYDFDDIGVPSDPDKIWRQKSTEKWLQKLIDEGQDTCLLGQFVLGEILACKSAARIHKFYFCLLDVNDFERNRRLKKSNNSGLDKNMQNWSEWLRMHNTDPQWRQDVIKENCWSELDFSDWENLPDWPHKVTIDIIDTTRLSIREVSDKVANRINTYNEQ